MNPRNTCMYIGGGLELAMHANFDRAVEEEGGRGRGIAARNFDICFSHRRVFLRPVSRRVVARFARLLAKKVYERDKFRRVNSRDSVNVLSRHSTIPCRDFFRNARTFITPLRRPERDKCRVSKVFPRSNRACSNGFSRLDPGERGGWPREMGARVQHRLTAEKQHCKSSFISNNWNGAIGFPLSRNLASIARDNHGPWSARNQRASSLLLYSRSRLALMDYQSLCPLLLPADTAAAMTAIRCCCDCISSWYCCAEPG